MKKALLGLLILAALGGGVYFVLKPKRPTELAEFYRRIHEGMSSSEVRWQLGGEPDRRVEKTKFGNVPLFWDKENGWREALPELINGDRYLVSYIYELPDQTSFGVEFDKETEKVRRVTDSIKEDKEATARDQQFLDSMGGPDRLNDILQRTKPKDKKSP
jgi:hypothetical protein